MMSLEQEIDNTSLSKYFKLLKKAGFDVSRWKNELGFTPLHIAAESGEQEIVETLVKVAHADVNARCAKYKTPLYYAALRGYCKIASFLVQYGATIHQGLHALHAACLEGHADVVKSLVKAGADVTEQDGREFSPARICCLDPVREPVAGIGGGGNTPKVLEAQRRRKAGKVEALAFILENGGDVGELRKGVPLLHQAAAFNYTECVTLLVRKGLDPNILSSRPNGYKDTALHQACFQGAIESVKELCRLGAHVDSLNSTGRTPLVSAVMNGQHECLTVLIQLGATVTIHDGFGRTPLHAAAACGQLRCAYLLVENGADVNALLNDGTSSPLVAALKPSMCCPSIIESAYGSKENRAKVAKFLLEMGAEVNGEVLRYATEAEMNDVVAERMARLKRSSHIDRPNLTTMAVEHDSNVVCVRLVDRKTGVDDTRVYRLNTKLIEYLTNSGGAMEESEGRTARGGGGGARSGKRRGRERGEKGGGDHGDNFETSSTSSSSWMTRPLRFASSSVLSEAPGSNVIVNLLYPGKSGFKSGIVSSDGKELKLEYDGTDFTKEGFAAAVEFLTTAVVESTLVSRKKRKCRPSSLVGVGGGEEESAGDDSDAKCCLFDGDRASKALQAARYFCLEGMEEEVRRLMEVYGFEYSSDEEEGDITDGA